jgi:hypothetical protein
MTLGERLMASSPQPGSSLPRTMGAEQERGWKFPPHVRDPFPDSRVGC